jgi:hypothetical protein
MFGKETVVFFTAPRTLAGAEADGGVRLLGQNTQPDLAATSVDAVAAWIAQEDALRSADSDQRTDAKRSNKVC